MPKFTVADLYEKKYTGKMSRYENKEGSEKKKAAKGK